MAPSSFFVLVPLRPVPRRGARDAPLYPYSAAEGHPLPISYPTRCLRLIVDVCIRSKKSLKYRPTVHKSKWSTRRTLQRLNQPLKGKQSDLSSVICLVSLWLFCVPWVYTTASGFGLGVDLLGSGVCLFSFFFYILADRTNGGAYTTVLRSSSVTLCIVAKRCVIEQKLLLTAKRKSHYEKSIGTKMNDLDLCL